MSAQIISLDGYRAIRKLRDGVTLRHLLPPITPSYVRTRPRGDAWKMSRRCAICREPGHDRSTCELADEARALSKTLGVTFGDALARITSGAK